MSIKLDVKAPATVYPVEICRHVTKALYGADPEAAKDSTIRELVRQAEREEGMVPVSAPFANVQRSYNDYVTVKACGLFVKDPHGG